MSRTTRRYGLQAEIYVTNPWALIETSIRESCPALTKKEAVAAAAQAQYFFQAVVAADEWAAKPLLLYYSLMNLAKAYALTKVVQPTFDQAQHGVSERLQGNKVELIDAYLRAFPSPGNRGPNIFADFHYAVSNERLAAETDYDLVGLLPQIVAGHRIWCDAANKNERFVGVRAIKIMQASQTKKLWLVVEIFADQLTRLNVTRKQFLKNVGLDREFRPVTGYWVDNPKREVVPFEQMVPIDYGHRTADKIPSLVSQFRHKLWATVNASPPHRTYYLYQGHGFGTEVLPQLLSMYGIAYYLGSITRYRPQQFASILQSKYGGFVKEILTSVPFQFLYLIASEFAQREVTRPSIV